MPSSLISFCLGATFDTVPSPSNLKRCRLITESSCFLCWKSICTSEHILGDCKIALHPGRFSLRHDKVLCELVVILNKFFHHISQINHMLSISSTLLRKEKNLKQHLVKVSLAYYTQLLTGIQNLIWMECQQYRCSQQFLLFVQIYYFFRGLLKR